MGGPIQEDKLFYFFNWEWFMWPNQVARTRYLMNPQAQTGLFTYAANDGSTRTIDLLALAAANGQLSSTDPTILKVLADIRSAAAGLTTGGAISSWDLNTDKFDYSPSGEQFRHFPTVRFDDNLTQNHRLTGTARYNRFESDPDILNSNEPNFPGFQNRGGQWSHRYMWQATLRSTFGKSIVNEARYGFAGGTTQFYPDNVRAQFDCTDPGCQGPFNLDFTDRIGGGGRDLTSATTVNGPSSRYVPDAVYEDTVTWLKGVHTLSFGGSYTMVKFENWDNPGGVVPAILFATNSNDPAYAMLSETSGNYPGGINSTQAGYARNLYAILTGRVNQISGTYVLTDDGTYQYISDRWQKGSMDEIGLFVSDSWRLRPDLTVTGGLRWEIQLPFKPDTTSFSRLEDPDMVYGLTGPGNLFTPGTMTGTAPIFVQYLKGDHAYNTDWNNVAPSIGVAWRPHLAPGVLASILSEEPVFRGGYSVSYDRYGTGDFTGRAPSGRRIGASRSATWEPTACRCCSARPGASDRPRPRRSSTRSARRPTRA